MRPKSLYQESSWSSLDNLVKYNFIILLQREISEQVDKKDLHMREWSIITLFFIFMYHNYKMCWNSAGNQVYWLLTHSEHPWLSKLSHKFIQDEQD